MKDADIYNHFFCGLIMDLNFACDSPSIHVIKNEDQIKLYVHIK